MDEIMSPAEIERRATEAGLSVKDLCLRAGIAQSTFYRWRNGDTDPQMRLYRRIASVLRDALAA